MTVNCEKRHHELRRRSTADGKNHEGVAGEPL